MLIYVDLFEKMVLKQSKENLTDTKTQTIKLRLGKDQLNMVRDHGKERSLKLHDWFNIQN